MDHELKYVPRSFPTVPVNELLGERFFERQLLRQDGRSLIRSVCRRCGTVIIGSVMDTLSDDEVRHVDHCTIQR